ncbi:DoxX family protein [Corynebacterium glyciniphilum]|uniref:DoxX family protein n=1 Tax=Corynebacterium glyciniphilum TaxID=1404244 RepID=UPI001C9310EE|nr:DoxX family protein [Corynebacterium glyciniphilum]
MAITLLTGAVVGVTVAANIFIAAADLLRARFVLENSAEVNVPAKWLPTLAVLKGSGGVGLSLWFFDVPVVPTVAAAGLVCFFLGANLAHLRARVFHTIAFPGFYLALAASSLSLIVLDA